MGERKYGAHFSNGLPNYDLDPVAIVGDVLLPPLVIADLEIPMPCGVGEIVAALNHRGISIPNDERQNALVGELLVEIAPLAKKIGDVLAKRKPTHA